MIKITKHFYIHCLTVLLFAVGYITRQLEIFALCYLIMIIHELAHLAAALSIGLIPSKIVIYPFGVNLKLKNKMVYSLADEIILYAAGPLSNICMALACLPFINRFGWAGMFYSQNITLFILNMLPILPLDGGVIVKKVISNALGYRMAEKLMKVISFILILFFCLLGLYISIKSHFNYSICFLVLFLAGNIFTSGEKYNIDFIRELMFYQEKGKHHKKVKTLLMREGEDWKKTAVEFSTGSYYVVFSINEQGEITDILTETQIMENITKKHDP